MEEGKDELGDRERLMWWWKRSRWSETVKGFGLLAETTSWVDCHLFLDTEELLRKMERRSFSVLVFLSACSGSEGK